MCMCSKGSFFIFNGGGNPKQEYVLYLRLSDKIKCGKKYENLYLDKKVTQIWIYQISQYFEYSWGFVISYSL